MATYGYTFQSGDGVTPTRLNDARTVSEIVNADIKSDAAIAGTKISPDFGSQNIQTTGNLAFGGTGNRITGDFSNATHASRVQVQGSATNQQTAFSLIPNGTGTTSQFIACASSDPDNSSRLTLNTTNALAKIAADKTGTGTYLPLSFDTGGTERMRIDASGYVLLSRTSTSAGNSGWYFGPSGVARGEFTSGQVLVLNRIDVNGTAIGFHRAGVEVGYISVTTTATTYSTSSDYRLKDNAIPITGGLSTIAQLKPVSFIWKSDGSEGRGFIAHELQSVVPEAVTGEKDAVDEHGNPKYQGVDASKLVPYLVAAVQELSGRVKALEA